MIPCSQECAGRPVPATRACSIGKAQPVGVHCALSIRRCFAPHRGVSYLLPAPSPASSGRGPDRMA